MREGYGSHLAAARSHVSTARGEKS
jgi:hypothetical protein